MKAAAWSRQVDYELRFDWGPADVTALGGEIVVVVDVLRFTTAVEAGVAAGLSVYP